MNKSLFLSILPLLLFLACQKHQSSNIEKWRNQFNTNEKYVCLYFFMPECVISESKINDINSLQNINDYKEIAFRGIIVSPSDLHDNISAYKEYQGVELEVIADYKHKYVELFNIKIAPTVLLFKENELIYNGLVDDAFYDIGKKKKGESIPYLENAIISSLNNEPIQNKQTKSIGCRF